jgi:hypothetical protein
VFTDAHGVRPDQPHATGPGEPHDLVQPGPALGAGVGEAAGHHHQAADPLERAGAHDVRHVSGRHGDDGQVDGVRDRGDVAVRPDPDTCSAAGFTG